MSNQRSLRNRLLDTFQRVFRQIFSILHRRRRRKKKPNEPYVKVTVISYERLKRHVIKKEPFIAGLN